MGKIFCLMGKSNSGKDTIFKLLKEDKELNLKPVIPYTTRPKRNNERNGVEYYFINEDILLQYEDGNKLIEKREYNTVNGKWYYCTIDDGQIDLERENYSLITTLEAYKKLKKYFKEENVIPIYIAIDDGLRLERALNRERQQKKPDYNELCRRFLADNIDFSDEKLNSNNIHKQYINFNLEECIMNIKEDLLKLI
jgi:guanylate kinase